MVKKQPFITKSFSQLMGSAAVLLVLAGCNLPSATATPPPLPTPTLQPPLASPTEVPPTPTSAPSPTLTPAPVNIVFATGATAAVQSGTLQPGQSQVFTLSAGQNQPMVLILDSPSNDLYFGVTEPDGNKLLDPAKKWNRWQWLLPKTEVYTIQVYGGAAAENYTLTAKVAEVVNFPSGSSSTTLNGTTVNGFVVSYAAYCTAGQTMTATLNVPATTAYLDVFGLASGPLLSQSAKANSWTGTLPSTEDYVVEVIPNNGQVVSFSLALSCH
ncbi:MAG TPA: hypothetical protein VMC09_11105 [Anaerolineales bacterium]|nr:hypothetical protein [Anaerolineales bacterium]